MKEGRTYDPPRILRVFGLQAQCSQVQSRNADLAARLEAFVTQEKYSKAAMNEPGLSLQLQGKKLLCKVLQLLLRCTLHFSA